MSIRCAVLFPGALGDFICFLPALMGLRGRHDGEMLLAAAPALLELVNLGETSTLSIDSREVSALFSPDGDPCRSRIANAADVYSWTGFHDPDFRGRLLAAGAGRVGIYRFRGMLPGEHATDYYARCVGLRPHVIPAGVLRSDDDWVAAFRTRHGLRSGEFLLIHPGSGAPRKNWQGFAAVARAWRQRCEAGVVVLHGPAERDGGAALDGERTILVDDLSLPQVAGLLRDSGCYLGNDSGISHLAGVLGARGVVVFGSSDPVTWAPRGGRLRVLHAPQTCAPCGAEVFCEHRLPAEVVVRALLD